MATEINNAKSTFPDPDEIKIASHVQLAYWMRYLGSPGMSAAGSDNFDEVMKSEATAQALIMHRFDELGGWRPKVSKAADEMHRARPRS